MDRSADWLRQAEVDLQAAADNAGLGHHEWAAFMAQQAAEKAVKALIQHLHGAERGHSITGLLRETPVQTPAEIFEAAGELDRVYVTSRYPNGFASGTPGDHFTAAASRRLIQYAQQVVGFCRDQIHRP